MKKLKEVYSGTQEQDLYAQFKELRSFKRQEGQSIAEYIAGFQSRADRINACDSSVKLPSKLLSMMLIDHANLSHQEETALFGACAGRLDLIPVTRALKIVMETEKPTKGAEDAYMIADGKKEKKKKYRTYCKKKGHEIHDCWKKHPEKCKKAKGRRWKFCIATKAQVGLSPIVDSAATHALVGIETLKRYLYGINKQYKTRYS